MNWAYIRPIIFFLETGLAYYEYGVVEGDSGFRSRSALRIAARHRVRMGPECWRQRCSRMGWLLPLLRVLVYAGLIRDADCVFVFQPTVRVCFACSRLNS